MEGVVYKITNLITNDFYIGQTKNFKKRIRKHHQKGIHSKLFDDHIAQYGWRNFKAEVLEECDVSELKEREAYYIELLKPTYNTIVRGRPRTEITREKLSKALSGKKQSPEIIEKRRQGILKRHETIPQLNLGHRKKVASDEGCTFESVKAMALYYEVSASTITHALKKNHKVKGHKVWYVV